MMKMNFIMMFFMLNMGKVQLKLRSMVGLIPLFAVEVLDPEIMKHTLSLKND
jgi:hypothetical protein